MRLYRTRFPPAIITVRCCVLGSALMRSTCCIKLGAGLRLRAAVCGSPINSSTLTPSVRANNGSADTGTRRWLADPRPAIRMV